MASIDKEIKVLMLKGEAGKTSYDLAVENLLFSGTLEEWIETFATPENYITRLEFQKVTQAEYDEMEAQGELIPNTFYLITDDDTYEEITTAISNLNTSYTNLSEQVSINSQEISNLQQDITRLEDDITNTNSNVTQNTNDIADLRIQVNGLIRGGRVAYSTSSEALANLISQHPNVKLWCNWEVSASGRTEYYYTSVNYSLNIGWNGTITVKCYKANGDEVDAGQYIYYEYLYLS